MFDSAEFSSIVGIFDDQASARSAVAALELAGFPAGNIGIEEGDAESSGLAGALTTMGVPPEQARAYASARRAGSTLVTVSTADRPEEARGILQRFGGAIDGASMHASDVHEAAISDH